MSPDVFEGGLAGGTFLVSAILTGAILGFTRRAGIIDQPNERSSHSVPTPRGGGLAIVLVQAGALLLLAGRLGLWNRLSIALAVGGALIAAIGFADDRRHVPSIYRLLIHIVSAVLAVGMLSNLLPVAAATSGLELGWAGCLLASLLLVWFINLFNFMDGIDGIAAAEAVFVAGAMFVLSHSAADSLSSMLLLSLASASAGFLIWNWPPAKIFLGDVGSGFLGFGLGVLALSLIAAGQISVWTVLILTGVFVCDASITLLRRMLRGDRWYSAHRSHAYQRAARRWRSHARVTTASILINIGWLLPLAWVSDLRPDWGYWLCPVAWLPLAVLSFLLGAGRPD